MTVKTSSGLQAAGGNDRCPLQSAKKYRDENQVILRQKCYRLLSGKQEPVWRRRDFLLRQICSSLPGFISCGQTKDLPSEYLHLNNTSLYKQSIAQSPYFDSFIIRFLILGLVPGSSSLLSMTQSSAVSVPLNEAAREPIPCASPASAPLLPNNYYSNICF